MKYLAIIDIDTWEFWVNGRVAVVVNDGEYIWDCWKDELDRVFDSDVPEYTKAQIERDALEWLAYQDLCNDIDYLRDTDPEAHQGVIKAMSEEFGEDCSKWNWV